MELKRSQKVPHIDTQALKKITTLSKLRFVHRRSVLEPPKPKGDYHYYTLGVFEILILPKSDENTVNTMLLETPGKPVLARNGKRVSMRRVCQALTSMVSTPGQTDTE